MKNDGGDSGGSGGYDGFFPQPLIGIQGKSSHRLLIEDFACA